MKKEYGKLTPAQFAELIQFVPTLLKLIDDLGKHMASVSGSRFDDVMTGDYGDYCHIYETPFIHHLSVVIVALNRHGDVHAMSGASDPQEAVLEVLRTLDQVEDDRPLHEAFDESTALALIYALGRTVISISTYGRSISGLLDDVRERNDQGALFKAVRMDRAVIGCPTAMRLISRAQLRDNKAFFKRLRSALAGPGKKQWEGREPMRYAFILLNEMGVQLTEAELETLMVDVLKAYPRNPGARKNLRAQYQQFRKYKTI
ncbi:hypothetical protein [Macromonas nakdongensis]|uniref:hypothetical protein n=1 Tax=Macromonas nakdongensis TaxID=1843082 RepID=UPI0012FE96EA|nr:hypothetical protein [Macromonas nakdongensis]